VGDVRRAPEAPGRALEIAAAAGDVFFRELAVGAPYEAPDVAAINPPRSGRVYLAYYSDLGYSLYNGIGRDEAAASDDEHGDFYGGALAGGVGLRGPVGVGTKHLFIGAAGEAQGSAPRKGAVHGSVTNLPAERDFDWIWAP
jgi:hypothetical protein